MNDDYTIICIHKNGNKDILITERPNNTRLLLWAALVAKAFGLSKIGTEFIDNLNNRYSILVKADCEIIFIEH